MKIVCVGDSLTAGYGVSKKANWVSFLKENLNHEVINKGVNGDTSFGVLTRSFQDIIALKPNICIVLIGTNDLLMNRSVENTLDNIKTLVKEMVENDILPVVAFPPKILPSLAKEKWCETIDYQKVNDNLLKLRNLLLAFCSKNSYKAIDLYEAFSSISEGNSYNYYLDGVHLNTRGHEIMYNLIVKVITECI